MPNLAWVLVAVCIIASLVVTVSGDERIQPATRKASSEPATTGANLLTAADVAAAASGSPESTVLTWARAVQESDAAGVRKQYSRSVRRTIPSVRLDAATRTIGELLGRPRIVSVQVRNSRATARVSLESFGASGVRPALVQSVSVELVREDGAWRFADATLLLATADDLRELRSRTP